MITKRTVCTMNINSAKIKVVIVARIFISVYYLATARYLAHLAQQLCTVAYGLRNQASDLDLKVFGDNELIM